MNEDYWKESMLELLDHYGVDLGGKAEDFIEHTMFVYQIEYEATGQQFIANPKDGDNGDNLDRLIGRLEDGCLELEREITLGGRIGWQDRKWHIFKKSGDSVNYGANSLFELIASLSPNENFDSEESSLNEN